jgi:hypothetical protein
MGVSTHGKTLLHNVSRLKSNTPPPARRRIGPHTRLTRVWSILLASLLLDVVWVFVPHTPISEEIALALAITCAVLTLPFLNQNNLALLLSRLRSFGRNPEQKNTRMAQRLLLVVLVLLVAGKLVVLPSLTNILGVLCAAVVCFGILRSIQQARQAQNKHAKELQDSPWLQVILWEQQIVIISCIALAAARLVSLFGSLSLKGTGVTSLSLGSFGASVLLLLCLKPNRSAFIGICKRCKTPIPITFVDYGSCPSCDKALQELL